MFSILLYNSSIIQAKRSLCLTIIQKQYLISERMHSIGLTYLHKLTIDLKNLKASKDLFVYLLSYIKHVSTCNL